MKHENSIEIFIIVGFCFNISHNCWFFFLNLEWEHVMIISNSWCSRDQQLAQTPTTVHSSNFILSHLCDIKTHCTKQNSVKLKKNLHRKMPNRNGPANDTRLRGRWENFIMKERYFECFICKDDKKDNDKFLFKERPWSYDKYCQINGLLHV